MFSSICNSVKRKLLSIVGKEVIQNYDLSVGQYQSAVQQFIKANELMKHELESYQERLAIKSEEAVALRKEADGLRFELESVQQPVVVKEQVWVMAPEVYKKFCASFGAPVINGNSHKDEAAFKLGVQCVLARIGEAYVSR